ncbi:MAG: Holliday junction branch migration protein RuvA [Deltaproteobacteria bacterium]|nr:Holliday junction branch migration protein RuvA [Deltaproteobacteria bacterium]MDE0214707.1 Holliday junction branch migration protein RuvA [Deltaproteobacteria bacterium]
MIAKVRGILDHKAPGEVIVDVGGVGYQLFTALSVFYRLPEVGEPVTLLVYTHVREDALQLFGFFDPVEKQAFVLLTGVSGIGPRLALNVLSGMAAEELLRALRDGDVARLVSIPGVGKRLADRMIVELRDKIDTLPEAAPETPAAPGIRGDALSALVNLGYRRADAERAVRQVLGQGAAELETVLKEALRVLSL